MTQDDPYYAFRILSYDPLVTVSGCQTDNVFLAKMAEDVPEVFAGRKGLHILLPTWNMEGSLAVQMRDSIEAASRRMPGHEFLVIANTEYEAHLLGRQAVPALFANQSMFLDEDVWKPIDGASGVFREFDAVYNARLDRTKRHELARQIGSLSLVYGPSIDERTEIAVERVRGLLPAAYFANAAKGGTEYSQLSPAEIVELYAKSCVGLCLSREEGYSRVSVEYMLCGLPVVSTASIGGRDRYYSNEYCRVVDDDPQAVAAAVRQLIAQNHSPREIRQSVLQLLRFDRINFLKAINRIVADHTGRQGFFALLKPFIGIKMKFLPHSTLLRGLKEEFAARHAAQADRSFKAQSAAPPDRDQSGDNVPLGMPPSLQHFSVGYFSIGAGLTRSLDAWKAQNASPKFFIRDDDIENDNPALRNLLGLSEWLAVPVLLSAIPENCERTLGRVIGPSGLITVAVHGYSHKNYAPAADGPCELCSDRPLELILNEIKAGREIVSDVFGERLSGLLVPPWNRIDDRVAEAAMALGFQGLSVHGWERMNEPIPRINTHVDMVDWNSKAVLTRDKVEDGISHQLDVARTLGFPYVGIVTHHRYFSDDDWKTLSKIVTALSVRGAEWVAADTLLPSRQAPLLAGALH